MNLLLRPRFPLAQGNRPPIDIWQEMPERVDDDDEIIPVILAIYDSRWDVGDA